MHTRTGLTLQNGKTLFDKSNHQEGEDYRRVILRPIEHRRSLGLRLEYPLRFLALVVR